MPAKMKACTALLVTLVTLTGCGPGQTASSTARTGDYIALPGGNTIIYLELEYYMGGASEQLYIYENGMVIYVENTNLRFHFK
jgi:hypothetical protein